MSTDAYLKEYTDPQSVQLYVSRTAGTGISYLLSHVYGTIYRKYIDSLLNEGANRQGWRVLEYGCGGGMNLVYLVKLMAEMGIRVDCAYGTDFSDAMIQAARAEVKSYLTPDQLQKVQFVLAPNENLSSTLCAGLAVPPSELNGRLHLIVGVNTFRYCHRLGASERCAQDIFNLLRPGGISIMIDMNNSFPFFRSRIRDKMTKPKEQIVLPSLQQYKQPFERIGFKILEARNFCWIPHSATGLEFSLCKLLNPLLDRIAPGSAMRSLVVAQKPRT